MKKLVLSLVCMSMLMSGCTSVETDVLDETKEFIPARALQEYEGKLYSSIPGSTEEDVVNTNCKWGEILVYNGKVYYTRKQFLDTPVLALYRSNLDGTEEEFITEDIKGFCIYGEELYCENAEEETVVIDLGNFETIENKDGYIFDASEENIWKEVDGKPSSVIEKEPVNEESLKKELKLEEDAKIVAADEFVFYGKEGRLYCYNQETQQETVYEVEFFEDIYWWDWCVTGGKVYIYVAKYQQEDGSNQGYMELDLETGESRLIVQWFQP